MYVSVSASVFFFFFFLRRSRFKSLVELPTEADEGEWEYREEGATRPQGSKGGVLQFSTGSNVYRRIQFMQLIKPGGKSERDSWRKK